MILKNLLVGLPIKESLPLVVDMINKYDLDSRIHVIASGKLITPAEAAWAHASTYPSRADDYGPDYRRLLENGVRVRGAEYAQAHAAREAFRGRLRAMFEEVDILVCPSMPVPPPTLAEFSARAASETAVPPLIRFTAPFDFSGSPTLSLPCGVSADGLPLSVQLVGRDLAEDLLCRAGHAFEQATDWHELKPPV